MKDYPIQSMAADPRATSFEIDRTRRLIETVQSMGGKAWVHDDMVTIEMPETPTTTEDLVKVARILFEVPPGSERVPFSCDISPIDWKKV